MTGVSVWAPRLTKVFVEIDGKKLALTKGNDGWWQIETDLASHGKDYWILAGGEKRIPDPRSPWQPYGIDGPSRFLDHSHFPWSDQDWHPGPLSSAVLYELHVGTFSPEGTFEGVEKRLDHLADLGISHIELMPVNGFSGSRGWGYDGVDLYAPHEAYGGPEGLKHLVNASHRRGIAVILDVVYNHLGPTGNYLDRFGPYHTDRYKTPWGEAVNFDGRDSDEVRRFFCDNARMWLKDYHFDGLRLDAVHAIFDYSALHILEQLAIEVDALESHLGRNLVLIAESDLNNPRIVQSRDIGGYGIDAQWNDDFRHSLHTVLTDEKSGYHMDFGSLADLAKALTKGFVYDGRYSVFRRRGHGRPARNLSGHHFIGYLQNHDQIGNRPYGDRSSSIMSNGKLKIASALVFTSPFVPMLFQGEEWAASTPFQYFTDHGDPELGRAVSSGRREEVAAFGWKREGIPDPQDVETFNRSRLNWEEREEEPHRSLLDWHRKLIELRRRIPALTDGRMDMVCPDINEEKKWLVMERGQITVVCNFASSSQRIPIHSEQPRSIILSSDPTNEASAKAIEMAPESVAILGPALGGK